MVLESVGFFPVELEVTGGFEESVLGASHEVLFVLEKVELVGDNFLEIVIGSFSSDETVDEIAFGDLCVDEGIETIGLEYSDFWFLLLLGMFLFDLLLILVLDFVIVLWG